MGAQDVNGSLVQAGRDLAAAGKAIADRARLYDAETTGLKSQFQQAEAAVASLFGCPSAEYQTGLGHTLLMAILLAWPLRKTVHSQPYPPS